MNDPLNRYNGRGVTCSLRAPLEYSLLLLPASPLALLRLSVVWPAYLLLVRGISSSFVPSNCAPPGPLPLCLEWGFLSSPGGVELPPVRVRISKLDVVMRKKGGGGRVTFLASAFVIGNKRRWDV